MFSNNAEPEANFDPNKIAEAFLWDKMAKQTSYAASFVDPKDLQVYTGRYVLSGMAVITFTVENDKLYSQVTGQGKFQVFPFAEDQFFWKVVDAKVKFIRDYKGAISYAVLFQNGQELKANKLKEDSVVAITPAIMDDYTGKFTYKDDITLTVFIENNKLYGQPSGQAKLELYPVSDTDFIIKEINAKISFVKDGSGKVTKIRLTLNGEESELRKLQ